MIHGYNDGQSHFVTYLHCTTDKKSDTVLQLFQNAVVYYALPSRVCADFGTKNVKIARYILECPLRHVKREIFITDKSVHNQRTERLWGEVGHYVVRHYKNIFNAPFCFPLCLFKKTNKALAEFFQDWNFHPLSSTNNQSPRQL